MKKLLRFTALILAVCTLLSLAACGKKAKKLVILDTEFIIEDYAICFSKENDALLNDVNKALEELIADGSVKKVVDKYISGVAHDLKFQENTDGLPELKMATNAEFPPYEYFSADNKIDGIDAEIAGLIADKLGMKLVIESMEFGSIIAAVQTGKSDFGMAGMTVTEVRLKSVNFSISYATGVQVIIVADGSKIASVDDLYAEGATYVVGVQQDTTGDIYSTDDFGDKRVMRYKTGADAVQALLTGKVDCVIIDNEPAKSYVAINNK